MALNHSTAVTNFKSKFPHLDLLSFDGVRGPCAVQCPTHGEQRPKTYKSAMESAHGCPVCGREASRQARINRFRASNGARPSANKSLQAIKDLPPTLTDAEYRAEVLRLSSNDSDQT